MARRRSATDAAIARRDADDAFDLFDLLDGADRPDEHDLDLIVDALGLVGAARRRRR